MDANPNRSTRNECNLINILKNKNNDYLGIKGYYTLSTCLAYENTKKFRWLTYKPMETIENNPTGGDPITKITTLTNIIEKITIKEIPYVMAQVLWSIWQFYGDNILRPTKLNYVHGSISAASFLTNGESGWKMKLQIINVSLTERCEYH